MPSAREGRAEFRIMAWLIVFLITLDALGTIFVLVKV